MMIQRLFAAFFLVTFRLELLVAFTPTTFTLIEIRQQRSLLECHSLSTKFNSRVSQNKNYQLSMRSDDEGEYEVTPTESILGAVGMAAQPVVWVSLYYVATTGAGLPASPFGLLGAVEGISYLLVLGLVGLTAWRNVGGTFPSNDLLGNAEALSFKTLIAALLTLASLVVDQGCIPNAKPILDYSSYLPVCQAEDTPGFFGVE